MNIRRKIFFIETAGLILVVCLCGWVFYATQTLQQLAVDKDGLQEFYSEIGKAESAHLRWLRVVQETIISKKPKLEIGADGHKCVFGQWYYGSGATVATQMPQDVREVYHKIEEDHLLIHKLGGELIALWNPEQPEPAVALVTGKILPTANQLLALLKDISEKLEKHIQREESEHDFAIAWMAKISVGVICVLVFACVYMVYVIHGMLKPLKLMVEAAGLLVRGELEVNVPVTTSDEVGILAHTFNCVATSILEKARVAQAIAKRNLTSFVPLTSESDMLGTALIDMRYALYDSIGALATCAKKLQIESGTLSATNQVIVSNSQDTEKSITTIDTTVKDIYAKNADNAKKIDDAEVLTGAARKDSTQGRELMSGMMSAMTAITRSASEIKKIIKVIDDIAFQTNLLALNAAVEAARAGQHGKGFAVVAEEVRNLASRSAKAAKETADLIEEAIRHVTLGESVAQSTANSLNAITKQVEQVGDIIHLIAEASRDQTGKLQMITSDIDRVCGMAADNNSRVSESASSMHVITSTAAELSDLTSRFAFNEGGKVQMPHTGEVIRPKNRK